MTKFEFQTLVWRIEAICERAKRGEPLPSDFAELVEYQRQVKVLLVLSRLKGGVK